MSGGYTVPINADTKAYKQQVDLGMIKPTEDAQKALDGLGKSRGPEQLERDLRDAQKATERLADETKQAADDIDREFRDSYRRARQSADEGLDGMRAKTEEVGDELKQNLGETFSSFRGDMRDLPQIAQDTLGGLAGSGALGGIPGIAATAAGAAGLGLIIGALENGELTAEQFRAKVQELAEQLIAAGTDGGPSIDYLVERLQTMATAADDGEESLSELKALSDQTGSDFTRIAQAAGLNTEGLRELWRESRRQENSIGKMIDASGTYRESTKYTYDELIKMSDAQGKVTDYLGQQIGLSEAAAEQQRLYAEAGGPELEAKAALLSTVNDAYDDAAGAAADYLNQESGLLDVQGYIDAMNTKSQALADYQTNLLNSGLSPEAMSFLNDQGAEAAAQFLQGYTGASDAQKAELNRIWTEAGKENSGEYSKSVKGTLPERIDKKPRVELQADTWQAERDLDRVASRRRTATIYAEIIDPRTGKKVV